MCVCVWICNQRVIISVRVVSCVCVQAFEELAKSKAQGKQKNTQKSKRPRRGVYCVRTSLLFPLLRASYVRECVGFAGEDSELPTEDMVNPYLSKKISPARVDNFQLAKTFPGTDSRVQRTSH